MAETKSNSLLRVDGLHIEFRQGSQWIPVVQDLSFEVEKGKTLGIVGESGSGKSISCLSIMQLLPQAGRVAEGSIEFFKEQGYPTSILDLAPKAIRKLRGKSIAMVFQEPMSSLNPVIRCGAQVAEAIRLHQDLSRKEAKELTLDWFSKVELPRLNELYDQYPHQLSGGQKQRVMIAMAMCCQPQLLIADEPTTALDVTVQRSILALLRNLQAETDMSVIFISHDLGVIAEMADQVLVMHRGLGVEQGPIQDIFERPQQAYTQGLLACRPSLQKRLLRLPTIEDFTNESPAKPELRVESREDFQNRLDSLVQQPPLLKVQGLKTWFPQKNNWKGEVLEWVKAVDQVSFDIYPGETLGLVGESGSGKTTLGRSILCLQNAQEGSIQFDQLELTQLPIKELRQQRKHLQIIFQDPFSSLNPRMTVGKAIQEPMFVHGIGVDDEDRRQRVIALLEKVGLTEEAYHRYPQQFSGGQRQRIGIARALAVNPRFIVCDESVSALDVSVQATVLNLLKDLQQELGLTYLFISHDLSVVRFMCDRIMVMQSGKLVETGDAYHLFEHPQTEYTKQLIEAVPASTLQEALNRRRLSGKQ